MTYTPDRLSDCAIVDQTDSLPKKTSISAVEIAQLLSALPHNNLAALGGIPVRSHPYPEWPTTDDRDVAIVTEVVRSGRWGGAPYPGPYSAAFAKQFVEMQGGGIAVLMANGSVTMEVALRVAQIGWGDEVIVPAYTFQATAAAPIAAGAIPVFVDVDPQTYCISPAAIEAAITPKTRAVIPVHLVAQMADMDAIMTIAKQHNLIVIEDCAHAHGAQWNDQGAGTIGHFGSFSLQSSKILTTGEGGVLLCRTQTWADRATSLIDCGRFPIAAESEDPEAGMLEQLLHQWMQFDGQPPAFSLGSNYRMTEFQAALGTVALERFADQVSQRGEILRNLENQLSQIPGVRLLKQDRRQSRRSFYRYIFAIDPAIFGAAHDEVCFALSAEGIPCSPGYSAIHRSPFFQPQLSRLPVPSAFPEHFNFDELVFPETERACDLEAIWLDESIFRAGSQGVDDVISALTKIQNEAGILTIAKEAFLRRLQS